MPQNDRLLTKMADIMTEKSRLRTDGTNAHQPFKKPQIYKKKKEPPKIDLGAEKLTLVNCRCCEGSRL